MNQTEAKSKAREFVRAQTGVDADPDSFRLIKSVTLRATWRALYAAGHFFPDDAAVGAAIDGGEYIVDVDDETGEVSVFS